LTVRVGKQDLKARFLALTGAEWEQAASTRKEKKKQKKDKDAGGRRASEEVPEDSKLPSAPGGGVPERPPTLPLPLSREALSSASPLHARFELEEGVTLWLVDIRARTRPDDVAYNKNKRFWQEVPRGCCFVFNEGTLVHSVMGLPKFGYASDLPRFSLDTKGLEGERQLLYTEKANGEVFHISAFRLPDGRPCWVFGSKNVHMPILGVEHFESFAAGSPVRFEFATMMTKNFFATVPAEQQARILEYCLETGHTLSAEHCDPEHEVRSRVLI
jgi:hypothetical protein